MATVFTVGITAGVPTSGTGTVSTIDNMLGTAGSPSANYLSVQSTVTMPVAVSSATVTLSSNPTIASITSAVAVSSASPIYLSSQSGQITVSASITGGTITSLTSGTVAVSGGTVFTAAGSPNATQVITVQYSTNTGAASVVAISSGTVTLSSAISATSTPITTTIKTVLTSDGTNSTLVSSVSASIYGVSLYNSADTSCFLRIYNLSSAPTAGSSTYRFIFGVPPGAARDVTFTGALSSIGIGYTVTAGIASTDTTVVSSNSIIGMIEYA